MKKIILSIFLWSISVGASTESCKDQFLIRYIPFETVPYAPFTESAFEGTVRCEYKESDCKFKSLFETKKFKGANRSRDLRVKITDLKSNQSIYINAAKNIETFEGAYEISSELMKDVIDPMKVSGDKCAAKKKYDEICREQKPQTAKICNMLKQGKWR